MKAPSVFKSRLRPLSILQLERMSPAQLAAAGGRRSAGAQGMGRRATASDAGNNKEQPTMIAEERTAWRSSSSPGPDAASRDEESHRTIIIRCRCNADPAERWKSPPAMIFCDPYREDGSVRRDADDQVVFVHACRDHLSPKREEEIQRRELDRGWKKGELR
jgi:hypothetical protein